EGPWSFTYSDGEENHKVETNQSTYTIQTGKAGTYTIVDLSDAHCNGSVSGAGEARIAHYEVPSAVVSGGGTICSSETGELNVNLSGVAPWTFTYSDGKESHTVTTSDANYILKTNVGGVYEVTSVSDAHCNGQGSGSAELKFVATPVVAIDGGGTICEGSKAAINFAMDGQGPWIVDFTDGKNSFSFETEEKYYTLMVSEGGTYAVTNIRNGVCSTGSFTGVVEVEKVEKLNGTVTLQDTYCEGEDIRLSLDVNGNDSEINWSVEGGSGQFSFSSGSEVTYTPSDMDEEITFTASVENQCENVSFSAVTRISKMSSGYTTFPVTEEIVTQVGYDISATNTNGETYVWTFGDGTTQEGETINHTFTESGDYNVTLEIFEGDCVTENSFLIKVASNSNLFVPSVFNPTSTNAENRVVKVYGEDISTDGFSFKVFNRWGKVVYTTQNFSDARNSGWDGTYGSEPQENGVYTYLLQGKFNSGKQFEKTGTITLVK
ncbi:MAG: gliding motility-associated C-terminal domain-containing protein, partial [Cyclobacteriaceae bacterium]|nr:gliding motility-associated C-terminal domain-containing protein [Cyclobacteriaceae bacterium]